MIGAALCWAAPLLDLRPQMKGPSLMKTDIAIVGGGLTGLALARRLDAANQDYLLVEARNRLGGRIKSLNVQGQAFDLGPSWIWPGQERVFRILKELGLSTFPQWSVGDQVYQHPNGDVVHAKGFMSMEGSFRIEGGTSALVDALAAQTDTNRVLLNTQVTSVSQKHGIILAAERQIHAERVVITTPPRLAAELTFSPALPPDARSALSAIPTWMGAHAKFVAVYPEAFWRADGLSGDASSRRGPMVEIHDASPDGAAFGALFGFIGLPAGRRNEIGVSDLTAACIDQLAQLFGQSANSPVHVALEDWSLAPLTATKADAHMPAGHPHYSKPKTIEGVWDGHLVFAGTELAPDNGGLIEGALAAAEAAATELLGN